MRNVLTENLARPQIEKLIGLLASCYLKCLLWQIFSTVVVEPTSDHFDFQQICFMYLCQCYSKQFITVYWSWFASVLLQVFPQALFYQHCGSFPEQELCNSQRDCCHHLMFRAAQQAMVLQASHNRKPLQCLAEITPSIKVYGHLWRRLSSGHCVKQNAFF